MSEEIKELVEKEKPAETIETKEEIKELEQEETEAEIKKPEQEETVEPNSLDDFEESSSEPYVFEDEEKQELMEMASMKHKHDMEKLEAQDLINRQDPDIY
jgi:hypothetical protein